MATGSDNNFGEVRRRRIGRGKIVGKAAGLLVARKILHMTDADDPLKVHEHIRPKWVRKKSAGTHNTTSTWWM